MGLLRLICLLPHRAALTIGRAIGRLAYRFVGLRRAIVRRNVELCFPDLTPTELDKLAYEHFKALGMSIIEMGLGRWASDRYLQSITEFVGAEHLQKAVESGRGIILLNAHFTTLEISGRVLALHCPPIDAVYRKNSSDFITELQRSGRERAAETTIEKRDIKKIIRSLRNGRAIWYAPDQSYNRKGSVVVDFFGVPSMHTTATSSLAQLGKAVTLPFLPRRKADGSYVMTVLPAFDNFPSDDALADTRRYVKVLEDHIRTCPEQYLWIHRKFKGLPAEYPDLYADLDASK
jgi:KDO2-lipid IV(A) lauroyltransferase